MELYVQNNHKNTAFINSSRWYQISVFLTLSSFSYPLSAPRVAVPERCERNSMRTFSRLLSPLQNASVRNCSADQNGGVGCESSAPTPCSTCSPSHKRRASLRSPTGKCSVAKSPPGKIVNPWLFSGMMVVGDECFSQAKFLGVFWKRKRF